MSSISLNGSAPAPLAVGQDLLGAMLDAGLPAMYLCMAGSCGRCRTKVLSGEDALGVPTSAEAFHRCTPPERLACQATLVRDADIHLQQPV
jgi:ferredoxin